MCDINSSKPELDETQVIVKHDGLTEKYTALNKARQDNCRSCHGLKFLDYAFFEKITDIQEDNLIKLRQKLTQVEAKCAQIYFHEIFSLFPEAVRPDRRKTFKAYEGINNKYATRTNSLRPIKQERTRTFCTNYRSIKVSSHRRCRKNIIYSNSFSLGVPLFYERLFS